MDRGFGGDMGQGMDSMERSFGGGMDRGGMGGMSSMDLKVERDLMGDRGMRGGMADRDMGMRSMDVGRRSFTIRISNLPADLTWQEMKDKCKHLGDVRFAEIKEKGVGIIRYVGIPCLQKLGHDVFSHDCNFLDLKNDIGTP